MPDVTPNSPDDFKPFNSEYEHVRAHRGLEAAVESIGASGTTLSTVSVTALTATQIGVGGMTPGTASTAATIKGFYRTAAAVNVGIPSMSTASITATIVSVESQVGNPIQPGVPIISAPQAALPAGVYLGDSFCLDTNSITFSFFSRSGINATTTVAFHVFSIDTIP